MKEFTCRYTHHHHHHPLKISSHHHHEEGEHHHHHDHAHHDKRLLKLSFFITFVVMFVEVFAGIYANSLALVSDAIHMFTHAFALGLSLFALVIASKDPNDMNSFGYFRAEVLAAFINGLTIALSVVWIVYEAILRLISPEEILSQTTLIVAIIGLIVNLVTGLLLFKADHNNINIRSAFFHMMADTFSSVAIIIGAVIIGYTHLYIIDTLLAVVVAVVIAKWAYSLIAQSVHVLLEGSPVDMQHVRASLLSKFPQIVDVHDIHCWEISHNYYFFTAHIVVQITDQEMYDHMIDAISHALEDDFGIGHVTLQIESPT